MSLEVENFVLNPITDTVASVPRTARPFQARQYKDKQFKGGEEEWNKNLEKSATVYVGNLSFYTNEYQLNELFGRCGSIKRIIMGLDRIKKTPCGFCFVEYDCAESADKAVKFLSRTQLDGRDIKVDKDAGFQEGRQFGRGAGGGQVGDERRVSGGGQFGGRSSGGWSSGGGMGHPFTRSITVVACLTLISIILIAQNPDPVASEIIYRPPIFGLRRSNYYIVPSGISSAQLNETRTQFEKSFAQFLVNLMKSAKPTLMKAFIQATLADKQLKEIAISMFFNNTDTDKDEDRR